MILITSRSWWISMRYWEKSYYQERMEYRGANVWEDECLMTCFLKVIAWNMDIPNDMDRKSWFSSFASNFICNFTLGVNSKICFDYSSWIISLEERLNILIITTNYVYQKKPAIVKIHITYVFCVCHTQILDQKNPR